jgi:peroxiredoxin
MVVLAINQDTKNLSDTHIEKLKASIDEMGLEFPVLIDKEFEAWQKYGINALPTSVIVDREGKVAFAEPNYYWASQKKIKAVLAGLGIGKTAKE